MTQMLERFVIFAETAASVFVNRPLVNGTVYKKLYIPPFEESFARYAYAFRQTYLPHSSHIQDELPDGLAIEHLSRNQEIALHKKEVR